MAEVASKGRMKELNDTACVERVLGGDAEVFAVLVGRYSDRVFALIERICGDRGEAEELTQDTFVKAYENLYRFRLESSFSTWLYRIACNTAISHVRRRRVHFGEYHDERAAAEDLRTEDETGAREERFQRLERALEALGADDRALVHLFYRDDLPVAEIARITALSPANVKTRLHRIRKRLGVLMEIG
jgi:RNA polymerase sigma-70 factor (ECF subfamily)